LINAGSEKKSQPLAIRSYLLTRALDFFDLNQKRAAPATNERYRRFAKGKILARRFLSQERLREADALNSPN
jgi:hypothetical protein